MSDFGHDGHAAQRDMMRQDAEALLSLIPFPYTGDRIVAAAFHFRGLDPGQALNPPQATLVGATLQAVHELIQDPAAVARARSAAAREIKMLAGAGPPKPPDGPGPEGGAPAVASGERDTVQVLPRLATLKEILDVAESLGIDVSQVRGISEEDFERSVTALRFPETAMSSAAASIRVESGAGSSQVYPLNIINWKDIQATAVSLMALLRDGSVLTIVLLGKSLIAQVASEITTEAIRKLSSTESTDKPPKSNFSLVLSSRDGLGFAVNGESFKYFIISARDKTRYFEFTNTVANLEMLEPLERVRDQVLRKLFKTWAGNKSRKDIQTWKEIFIQTHFVCEVTTGLDTIIAHLVSHMDGNDTKDKKRVAQDDLIFALSLSAVVSGKSPPGFLLSHPRLASAVDTRVAASVVGARKGISLTDTGVMVLLRNGLHTKVSVDVQHAETISVDYGKHHALVLSGNFQVELMSATDTKVIHVTRDYPLAVMEKWTQTWSPPGGVSDDMPHPRVFFLQSRADLRLHLQTSAAWLQLERSEWLSDEGRGVPLPDPATITIGAPESFKVSDDAKARFPQLLAFLLDQNQFKPKPQTTRRRGAAADESPRDESRQLVVDLKKFLTGSFDSIQLGNWEPVWSEKFERVYSDAREGRWQDFTKQVDSLDSNDRLRVLNYPFSGHNWGSILQMAHHGDEQESIVTLEKYSAELELDFLSLNDHQTALHIACANGHSRFVKTLLDLKASPNIRDRHGRTPLDLVRDEATKVAFTEALARSLLESPK